MSSCPAIRVEGLTHRYGDHRALNEIDVSIEAGEIFGLLGANGGGKTTLFRVLSTLLPVQQGKVSLLGFDVKQQPSEIRHRIGVTFQSPSLDPKLTVFENLKHQSHLYGISGKAMRDRAGFLLETLGLTARRGDRVESLSGGLKRRVEIAKGLLHDPKLLLLDEPSTGLDPGARHELWRYLKQLRDDNGVTIVVTTHLMEEAELCDRLALLDAGRLVAVDSPQNLRASVGGDCLTIHCETPDSLAERISDRLGVTPQKMGESLRIEHADGFQLLSRLAEAFAEELVSVSLSKPSLEDVFIQRTGHRFSEETPE